VKRVGILVSLCFLIILLLLTSCGQTKIRVGAATAPERLLLAQMIILILGENGYEVVDVTPTGSREETWRAMINGDIDICPEYTGNYQEMTEIIGGNSSQIVWLKPAPADNKWGIAIKESLSEEIKEKLENEKDLPESTKEDIKKLKDELQDYRKSLPETTEDPLITGKTLSEFAFTVNHSLVDIKLICSPEFVTDKEALPKFQKEYHFELKSDQLVIFPSTNTAYLAQMAEDDRTIDAFMVYTTDGHLERYNLVLLEDNLGAQSNFNPAPIMLANTYNGLKDGDRDKINRILTPLFASIDDETLRRLNSKISLSGSQAIYEVARQYLIENGFFKYNELEMIQNAMEDLRVKNNGDVGELSEDAKKGTSDMSVFPNETNKLYMADNTVKSEITNNTVWSYITWSKTTGTYTCDSGGRVKQIETGWEDVE
jgi:osmoprotectant transport system substrate-binding protein